MCGGGALEICGGAKKFAKFPKNFQKNDSLLE